MSGILDLQLKLRYCMNQAFCVMNCSRCLGPLFGILCFSIFFTTEAIAYNPWDGNIRLPKIFSDHMVIQRGKPIKVWGAARPNEELTVSLNDHKQKATADAQGRWRVILPKMDAGGPFELSIVGKEASVVYKDVYVGEVWLCSGQSNMEWSLSQTCENETADVAQEKLRSLANSHIRIFTVGQSAVEKSLEDFTEAARWEKSTPESIKAFSAVAYYFADHLLKQPDLFRTADNKPVMVGLINSTWGGTPCEAWVSKSGLEQVPELSPLLQHWLEKQEVSAERPAAIYNGMIAPLVGIELRGAIWYQGESNVGRGFQYRSLFPALIADWRSHFGSELPFFFVQLAPFRYVDRDPRALPEVWEAQLLTLKSIPGTGMVVTTDIGDLNDIHPGNKQEVGRRLALWALGKVYQVDNLIYSGPVFESAQVDGNAIVIKFSNVGSGLQTLNGDLIDFQICAADRKFVDGTAQIVATDTIRVSHDEIDNPVAVRFAWHDSAQPNLVNSAGLPASPFRTDDFELLSTGIAF
ncbi:MAG TPA: sialate O-acetylesterase [Pirellulaceae bacterium]|nr:sialate O-acetylesterase [Pirellulaceae bacterium]HMO92929.1 sialate O-acetylesterase [Pirellulaceae bacterium]HMP71050.1 sialate O-acetylesterase [Pirellulaceae bacterium]